MRSIVVTALAVVAGAGVAAGAVLGDAGAQVPLPGSTTSTTTSTSTTPTETSTSTTPTQTTARARTITLQAEKEDVLSQRPVVLTGRVDPAPAQADDVHVQIGATTPGDEYGDRGVGDAKVAPDGTFRLVDKPERNSRYVARAFGRDGHGDATSEPIAVYADYVPRLSWRVRRGGRLEVAMLLSVPALVIDYFSGRRLQVYGFRRQGDLVGRRILRLKMFYTDPESSSGRAAAYARRRVRGARRLRFLLACVPERRPDWFGRPDDAIQRQCGRARLRLPAP